MSHGSLFVVVKPYLVIFIAVEQEDGIIHRHTQLKNRRQCLRYVRDFSEKGYCSQGLYRIAMPMLARNRTGVSRDSIVRHNTSRDITAAMTT